MSQELSESAQAIVDSLQYGRVDRDRALAEKTMASLSAEEKRGLALYLQNSLPEISSGWQRAWTISALSVINEPETVETVAARLDPNIEPFEWARYWTAVGLARMQPSNLEEHLSKVLSERSPAMRAVALRLLIESKANKKYVSQLRDMLEDDDWVVRRAACQALRPNRSGHKAFREAIEHRLLLPLRRIIHDDGEVNEVRVQAVKALGSIEHRWQDVVEILDDALRKSLDDWLRRVCIEVLSAINKPEIKKAMLFALEDSDAEIRERAATALKNALGASDAVEFIIDHLLRESERSERYLRYITALRQIDGKRAAVVLSEYMVHPDPAMAERASQALTELGGEAAVRTLQKQRTKAVETYTDLLGSADEKIMEQFESLMSRARIAFKMSMWMHGIVFGVGIITLMVSLGVALWDGFETYASYVGTVGAGGSVVLLLAMFYRDPLRNISQSVTNLIKVNVVFLGYVRQVNQIDATFKQLFLATDGFGIDQMTQTVSEIEKTVEKTLAKVDLYLEDHHLPPYKKLQDETWLKKAATYLNGSKDGDLDQSKNTETLQPVASSHNESPISSDSP